MLKRGELTNPASCMSRARDDEMTFVLLGRDLAAPCAIRAWIEERIRLGKNLRRDAQILEAETCAAAMQASSNPGENGLRFSKGETVYVAYGESSGRPAMVVGYSRDRECVWVVFRSNRSRESFHHSYFRKQTESDVATD